MIDKMMDNTLVVQKEMSRLDSIISKKYLGNSDPIPEDRLHIAYVWLEKDIANSLFKAENMDEVYAEICEILKKSFAYYIINESISLHRAYEGAKARKNFAAALRNVKEGSDLSGILNWSFSHEDLTALAKLHKSNRFRKKIEDLLTDCNAHSECSLMSSKNYSQWI